MITGRGRYVADIQLPGQLTVVVVRSPVAHATISSIDVDEARAADGVVAVWTAADLAADLGEVPRIYPRVSFDEGVVSYLQPVIAVDRVRYVGEPLCLVIGRDRYTAEDAAELVFADLEPMDAVVDPRTSASREPLFEPGNEVVALEGGYGDVDHAFARADVTIEHELATGRHSAVPMECRGLLVEFDPVSDSLIVHGATKVPHSNRDQLAGHLGIAPDRIRMRETSVGGGFGVRGEYYPEDLLVAWAALKLRTSASWTEDRREHFIATNQAREQFHRAAIAGDRDGRIVAIRTEFWADMGAYVRTHGIRVPDLTLSMLPGPYDIPNYAAVAHCVVTNRTPTATYRAPGRFESCFVRERLIDLFAARIGRDPVEVRRANLIRPEQIPYRRQLFSTGEPVILNEGNYPAMLDKVEAALDRPRLAARRARGERVGAGIAMFLEKSGLGPWESGSVAVASDGHVTVRSGCSSVGQGLRTVLAQIVGHVLDVPVDKITVELLDTAHTGYGTGSYASRSTATAGSAVFLAAEKVLDRARAVVADEFEVDGSDLIVRDGGLEVAGSPQTRMDLGAVAAKLAPGGSAVGDGSPGLETEEFFHVVRVTYPYGAHAAVVSVDHETGKVEVERLVLGYDVGRAVNPKLVEGQLQGGALQGLAGALLERFVYDDDGNPLVTSFMDYLMPTASEAPEMASLITEDAPTETNPLGVKGAGEGGLTGVAAAIAAAIDDAAGVPGLVTALPVDPEVIRRGMSR